MKHTKKGILIAIKASINEKRSIKKDVIC